MSDKPLNMKFYECNEIRHISKDCPNKQQICPALNCAIKACYECGDESNLVRNCVKRAQQKRSNGRGIENEKCYRCKGLGPSGRECSRQKEILHHKLIGVNVLVSKKMTKMSLPKTLIMKIWKIDGKQK